MTPQNGAKFRFEGEFAMMLLLIPDVADNRLEIRCADAEGAITLLPGEVFVHPFGGIGFQ